MTHKTVPVGPTPGLKRHALEAAQRLSMYAAAPFFPDVEMRGKVRQTTPEWWDGLANEIEEAQPLIHRALLEMAAPPSPVTELEVMLYEALRAFRDGGPEGGTDFNGWHQSYEEPCRLAREALAAYEAKKDGK